MKFKIGDRVRVVKGYDAARAGMVGTVRRFFDIDPPELIGVDFGPGFNGHNLKGAIPTETGWFVWPERLELLPPDTATSEPRPIKEGSKWRNVHREVTVHAATLESVMVGPVGETHASAFPIDFFRATHEWVSDPEPVEKPKVGDWLRSTDTGNYFILTPDRVNGTELFRSCCVDSPFRGSEPCEPPPLVKALDVLADTHPGDEFEWRHVQAVMTEWRALKAKMGVE